MTLRISGKTNFKGQTVIKQPLSAYNVSSLYEPKLVSDFAGVNNSGIEYYRSSGSVNTFNSLFKFCGSSDNTRDSNATMVDSDGKLKWAPHNLLTYSQDLEAVGWFDASTGTTTVTAGQSDPDGGTNAFLLVGDNANTWYLGTCPGVAAGDYTISVWLKSDINQTCGLVLSYGVNDLTNVNVTTDWQLFTFEAARSSTVSLFAGVNVGSGKNIYVYQPRVYRSDLGGMVDNPDRGDSYVPTTSSVRYLARRNHHTWDGSSWVNSGILLETEARTNLFTYSEDFTNIYWSKTNTATLAIDATGPDGTTSAVTLIDSNATGTGLVYARTGTLAVLTSTQYTASIFAKADQLGWIVVQVGNFSAGYPTAYFNLSTGQKGSSSNVDAATIEDCGGGWYRCAITFTTDAVDTTGNVFVFVSDGDNDVTVDLDGTSSILIYGAQLEEGSTPSSYIPTPGSNPDSTATRTAESLTIAAADMPWPTPNVIGPELVTNGTFDTDFTGWTTSSTPTVVSGRAELDRNGSIDIVRQTFTTVAGYVYILTGNVTGTIGKVGIGTTSLNDDILDASVLSGDFQRFFVATGTTTHIYLITETAGTSSWDNISVREIDPLSVSLQMQGKITYVDDGDNATATMIRWQTGGQYVQMRLRTDSTRTGSAYAIMNNGIATLGQDTNGAVADLSPGVLVPLNTAGRFGSTFLNVAMDGVSATALTTPTALPDLSATNFSLGYDYMGTIAQFRVWDKDITNTGIEEASQ